MIPLSLGHALKPQAQVKLSCSVQAILLCLIYSHHKLVALLKFHYMHGEFKENKAVPLTLSTYVKPYRQQTPLPDRLSHSLFLVSNLHV